MKTIQIIILFILTSFLCNSLAQDNKLSEGNVHIDGRKIYSQHVAVSKKQSNNSIFDTLYSFATPGTRPNGLAWDGNYFWNRDGDSMLIYKLNDSGDVILSFPVPDSAHRGGDLGWDGNYLWLADEQGAILYKIDPNIGMVIEQFHLPSFGQIDPNGWGLTWDGEFLWHSEYGDSAKIYKLSPINGQVISFFVPPKKSILGIVWAEGFLYGINDDYTTSERTIYKFESSIGTAVDSLPWEVSYPLGLVWDGDFFGNVSGSIAGGGTARIYKVRSSIALNHENIFVQPIDFYLKQNYPNPFNPSTKISWQSPAGSWQTLKIYDVLGNEVTTLVDEYKPAGKYEVEFDIHSDKGQNLSTGVYFYQSIIRGPEINSGQAYIETKKMILLK